MAAATGVSTSFDASTTGAGVSPPTAGTSVAPSAGAAAPSAAAATPPGRSQRHLEPRQRLRVLQRARSTRTTPRRRARLTQEHAGDTDVLGGKREQRELAGAFEGHIQRALMGGTGAGLAARLNLGAVGQETPQAPEILVVDLFDLVDAELADLATRGEFSAAAAATTAAELTGSASRSWASAAWSGRRAGHGHGCTSFLVEPSARSGYVKMAGLRDRRARPLTDGAVAAEWAPGRRRRRPRGHPRRPPTHRAWGCYQREARRRQ